MVKIVSDSTCDLPKELVEKYDISIIPLHIVMGETEYEDGFGLTSDDIFTWADKNKTTPKTSAPSLETAMKVLKPFVDNKDEILHPRINVIDGAMGPGKKYRGKIDKVIKDYIEDLKPELLNAKPDRIFITHSVKDRSIIDDTRKYLEELNVFTEILEAPTGGVISSHCGPGTLGLIFISK